MISTGCKNTVDGNIFRVGKVDGGKQQKRCRTDAGKHYPFLSELEGVVVVEGLLSVFVAEESEDEDVSFLESLESFDSLLESFFSSLDESLLPLPEDFPDPA